MASKLKNNYYINAPAGSGKTFYIKERINEILSKDPSSKILCITYTNRAAEEMENRIISNDVEISTIHSFMQGFIKPFLSLNETIEFYTDTYWDDILKEYEYRGESYREKYNLEETDLTKEIFIKNLDRIYYSELKFSKLLKGGLSHDKLLDFTYKMLTKFKIVSLKLKELYDYIFIDEVQDTTTEILKFFYYGNKDSETIMYFLGDKMQEVFDNYDGQFENEFDGMEDKENKKFDTNYRSTSEIVEVLNNIYKSNKTPPQQPNKSSNNIKPKIIICDSIEDYLDENSSQYKSFLKLRINNRMIFKNNKNNLEELFDLYRKLYPFNSKYSPTEVLLPGREESVDNIIKFIYLINNIVNYFNKKEYGLIIQTIKNTRLSFSGKKVNVFDLKELNISAHSHKEKYYNKINKIAKKFNNENDKESLNEFIEFLYTEKIISEKCNYFLNEHCNENGEVTYNDNALDYKEIFKLRVNKFVYLCELNKNRNISTQHGVKGEGHPKVLFVAEDNKNQPRIDMDLFLKLITTMEEFEFDNFQKLFYKYKQKLNQLLKGLDVTNHNEIKACHRDEQSEEFEEFFNDFGNNKYLRQIKNKNFEFNKDITIKNLKKLVKFTDIRGSLQAYKLFYVGCSRAEEELVVLIDKNTIEGFKDEFIRKFENYGFEVVQYE